MFPLSLVIAIVFYCLAIVSENNCDYATIIQYHCIIIGQHKYNIQGSFVSVRVFSQTTFNILLPLVRI